MTSRAARKMRPIDALMRVLYMSSSSGPRLAHQARGREEEYEQEEHEDHDILPAGGDVDRAHGFSNADEDSAQGGAYHAAHAAQHRDDEGLQGEGPAHLRKDVIGRGDQRAGGSRQGGAETEGDDGHSADVDAHELRRIPVLRRGSDRL